MDEPTRELQPFEGESRFEAAEGVLEAVVRHVNESRPPGLPRGVPRAVLKQLVEAAHWASLTTEEGLPADFALLLQDGGLEEGAAFALPVALSADAIAKLSPASSMGALGLVVRMDAGVRIVGLAPASSVTGLAVSANSPAVVTVHTPGGTAAVFERGRAFFLGSGSRWNLLEFLGRVLGEVPRVERLRFGDALVHIVSAVREERRGGTLLIVDGDAWRAAVAAPIPYTLGRPLTSVGEVLRELKRLDGEAEGHVWHPGAEGGVPQVSVAPMAAARAEALRTATHHVAMIAGVDGATVLTRELDLLAFGANITAHESERYLDAVLEHEVGTDLARPIALGDRLGTRHQSAARFVASVRDALAVVVSADGPVSIFAWSEESHSLLLMSHAERWLY